MIYYTILSMNSFYIFYFDMVFILLLSLFFHLFLNNSHIFHLFSNAKNLIYRNHKHRIKDFLSLFLSCNHVTSSFFSILFQSFHSTGFWFYPQVTWLLSKNHYHRIILNQRSHKATPLWWQQWFFQVGFQLVKKMSFGGCFPLLLLLSLMLFLWSWCSFPSST